MSKKKTTEIVCILDKSGSMGHLAEEVIQSFNQFIEEQRELDDPANVTLVQFNHKYEKPFDSVPIGSFPELSDEVYRCCGQTALHDAIGKTLNEFDKKKKNVVVLIQTDGHENASQEFGGPRGRELIRKMVTEKEKLGWNFVFIGANIDSFAATDGFGMSKGHTMTANIAATREGTRGGYGMMSRSVKAYRSAGNVNVQVDVADGKDKGVVNVQVIKDKK